MTTPVTTTSNEHTPGIGMARALALLAIGLAVNILCAVCLDAAGFPTTSAVSLLVSQTATWLATIWAAMRMGGASLRPQVAAFPGPRRLILPVAVATLGATVICLQIVSFLPIPDWLSRAARELSNVSFVPRVVSLGVIAPVAEEMFFRGIVLPGFLTRYSKTTAIWASAALFAGAHFNLPQAVGGLPLGIVNAYLFIRTGSIWPGVVSHAVLNASSPLPTKLLQLLGYSTERLEEMTFFPYPMLIAAVAMLTLGGVWLVRELHGRSFAPEVDALS